MARNDISSFASVSPNAILGKNNIIEEGVIIRDNVVIGDNNHIYPYVTIGLAGEVRGQDKAKGKVYIGNNNIIREFTSIQSPQRSDMTVVKDNCFIMEKVHIAHDCVIMSNVTIAPMTTLGGSVFIEAYANLGMSTTIHQNLVVGVLTMIGMGSVITKNVPSYETWYGNPAKTKGYNIIGLKRRYPELTDEQILELCVG